MKSIARLAGVAPMTVSRALRNPDLVAPATLARIMKVVKSVGFVPDQLASSLRGTRSIIGTVVPPLINSGIAEQVQGMSDACHERDMQLLLVQAGIEPARIRTTWQPAGDYAADNELPGGRALNRRVEVEIYRAAPQVAHTVVFARSVRHRASAAKTTNEVQHGREIHH